MAISPRRFTEAALLLLGSLFAEGCAATPAPARVCPAANEFELDYTLDGVAQSTGCLEGRGSTDIDVRPMGVGTGRKRQSLWGIVYTEAGVGGNPPLPMGCGIGFQFIGGTALELSGLPLLGEYRDQRLRDYDRDFLSTDRRYPSLATCLNPAAPSCYDPYGCRPTHPIGGTWTVQGPDAQGRLTVEARDVEFAPIDGHVFVVRRLRWFGVPGPEQQWIGPAP